MNVPVASVLERFTEGPDTGIFTDGGASPNPGPGGWGVVHVRNGQVVKQLHGRSPETTNNRMELTALIEALKIIGPKEIIDIYCDSELCVKTLTQWAAGWEKRGWRTSSGPVKNVELVQELWALFKTRPLVQVHWVKAHNGWLWNEYADALATAWSRSEL